MGAGPPRPRCQRQDLEQSKCGIPADQTDFDQRPKILERGDFR